MGSFAIDAGQWKKRQRRPTDALAAAPGCACFAAVGCCPECWLLTSLALLFLPAPSQISALSGTGTPISCSSTSPRAGPPLPPQAVAAAAGEVVQ